MKKNSKEKETFIAKNIPLEMKSIKLRIIANRKINLNPKENNKIVHTTF